MTCLPARQGSLGCAQNDKDWSDKESVNFDTIISMDASFIKDKARKDEYDLSAHAHQERQEE
jgi:hypothetical protein